MNRFPARTNTVSGPTSAPMEFLDLSRGFESIREKEEIARMHPQTAGIPDLALQAIDDGLTILRVFPAGSIEQKNISPYIHDVQ